MFLRTHESALNFCVVAAAASFDVVVAAVPAAAAAAAVAAAPAHFVCFRQMHYGQHDAFVL